MLLENYIKETLKNIVVERNFKKHFKKPFDYDLVMFDNKKSIPHDIYLHFKDDEVLWKNVLDIKVDNNSEKKDNSRVNKEDEEDIVRNSLMISRFSSIELKKNKEVIQELEKEFGFNFKNCNLSDNKPILCINGALGDFLKGRDRKKAKYGEKQAHYQDFQSNEDINWFLHDEHHHDAQISSDSKDQIHRRKVSDDKNISVDDINDYTRFYLTILFKYFEKTGYTKGIGMWDEADIWPSIYAYCLNMMENSKDAFKIDFTEFDFNNKKITRNQSESIQK